MAWMIVGSGPLDFTIEVEVLLVQREQDALPEAVLRHGSEKGRDVVSALVLELQ
jgi:hypothetical protein